MIRVAALDDHPLILEAYHTIFKDREDLVFIAGFPEGKSLMNFLALESCDIILLDMHLGYQESGLNWCKTIRKKHPAIKILGISAFDELGIIKSFIRIGGHGFILKSADPDIFVKAIQEICRGNEYFQDELKDALLQQTLKNQPSNEYIPSLSRREKEVLELIVDGQTTQEMAARLHLSTHTIESHRNNLMAKLNVNNVAGLVREALQKGLLSR